MKLTMLVIAAALLLGAPATPASAGSFVKHAHADAIVVCQRPHRHCWLEPGTRYRFYRLFGPARTLTETGALGVWRRDRVIRRHHYAR